MSYHLVVGGNSTTNWVLPPGTDLDDLKARLISGMKDGRIVEVLIQLTNNDPRSDTMLYVNGSALQAFAIFELDASGTAIGRV